eukprot:scaffold7464_cov136-Isochrysis_galbana.AAC.4
MDNGRGSGKAIHIYIPKPFGAHAKAAHVEILINRPCIPTKVSIMVMEVGNHEAVEVGEVVVYPLLPRLIISTKITRQPRHRVKEARRANLGVLRGVAHRSARRDRDRAGGRRGLVLCVVSSRRLGGRITRRSARHHRAAAPSRPCIGLALPRPHAKRSQRREKLLARRGALIDPCRSSEIVRADSGAFAAPRVAIS